MCVKLLLLVLLLVIDCCPATSKAPISSPPRAKPYPDFCYFLTDEEAAQNAQNATQQQQQHMVRFFHHDQHSVRTNLSVYLPYHQYYLIRL